MQLLLSAMAMSLWVEVEGTGAASVEHDDIGVERLVVAETGLGLGVAATEDEAWSRSLRWTSMRWCSCADVAGSSGSADGGCRGRAHGDAATDAVEDNTNTGARRWRTAPLAQPQVRDGARRAAGEHGVAGGAAASAVAPAWRALRRDVGHGVGACGGS